jgi:hypothetical protein
MWGKLRAVRIELTFKDATITAGKIERTLAHTVALRGRNLPVAPTI